MTDPQLLELAAALIEVFETCKLMSYRDSGGVWTIGIGHTKGVTAGMTCTRAQALQWFSEDQAPLLAIVAGKNPLAGAAYVSFGFNCGSGALKALLSGQIKFQDRIRDAKGTVQPGLVARRRLEEALVNYGKAA